MGDLVKSEVAEDGPGLVSRPQQRRVTKRQQPPVSEIVSALDERKNDIEVTNTYKYKFLEKVLVFNIQKSKLIIFSSGE